MFKKSPKTKQFDMFSPSGLLCEREGRLYDDPSAWHNTFYRDVTSNIDEEIFKPLYKTEKDDNRVGRTNVPIRILVAMIILKEGAVAVMNCYMSIVASICSIAVRSAW